MTSYRRTTYPILTHLAKLCPVPFVLMVHSRIRLCEYTSLFGSEGQVCVGGGGVVGVGVEGVGTDTANAQSTKSVYIGAKSKPQPQ